MTQRDSAGDALRELVEVRAMIEASLQRTADAPYPSQERRQAIASLRRRADAC